MQWACRGDRKGKTPELKPQHLSMAPLGKLYRVPGAYCDRHRCSDRLQERRLLIAPTNQTAKILKSGLLEIVFIKDNESSLCCQRGTRDLRKQCSVRLEGRKETNDVKKKTEKKIKPIKDSSISKDTDFFFLSPSSGTVNHS